LSIRLPSADPSCSRRNDTIPAQQPGLALPTGCRQDFDVAQGLAADHAWRRLNRVESAAIELLPVRSVRRPVSERKEVR